MVSKEDFKILLTQVRQSKEIQNLSLEVKVKRMTQKVRIENIGIRVEIGVRKEIKKRRIKKIEEKKK
jgi:hypothetical protein